MGFIKHIAIESKVYSISKNGNYVAIVEKSWRVLKELRLDVHTVHWFAKFLQDCLNGNFKDLYSTVRDGNHSFITQKCSNANGRYIALVEYS